MLTTLLILNNDVLFQQILNMYWYNSEFDFVINVLDLANYTTFIIDRDGSNGNIPFILLKT